MIRIAKIKHSKVNFMPLLKANKSYIYYISQGIIDAVTCSELAHLV